MTYDIIGKANMFLITICEQRANLQSNIPIAGVVTNIQTKTRARYVYSYLYAQCLTLCVFP